MAHFWLRHETRPDEARSALTPSTAEALIAAGHRLTVERSPTRALPLEPYLEAGAKEAPPESWPEAPPDVYVLGLKELPQCDAPLRHRHIMFGHAYKGQHSGAQLLRRFRAGGGTLLDLESLRDSDGRRLVAFGHWAGYAGAAVALLALAAQRSGGFCPPLSAFDGSENMAREIRRALDAPASALIIGAKGRVGSGAAELCRAAGIKPTLWDIEETAHGGPFPEIAEHDVFLNCIFARKGTPVFVPASMADAKRTLRVIGDIACDPDSDYNPVPLYNQATSWRRPALRVRETPPLDIVAIDNLPSLLPREASDDFAHQLLPHLSAIEEDPNSVWHRAEGDFETAVREL